MSWTELGIPSIIVLVSGGLFYWHNKITQSTIKHLETKLSDTKDIISEKQSLIEQLSIQKNKITHTDSSNDSAKITDESRDSQFSWDDVEQGVKDLKEKLIKDNFMPTLIAGIGRGGAITGALLSGCLGHIPLLVIDRVYDWSEDYRKEKLFDEIRLSKNLEKVLLVAGELHTGGTAKTYKEYFLNIGAKEIKFLTFTTEKYPNLKADYSYIECDDPEMRLPWMLTKEYKRDSKNKC